MESVGRNDTNELLYNLNKVMLEL